MEQARFLPFVGVSALKQKTTPGARRLDEYETSDCHRDFPEVFHFRRAGAPLRRARFIMSLLHYISEAVIEDKEKLEQDFLSFLRELGYPEDSIFRGPSFHLRQNGPWRKIFQDQFGASGAVSGNGPLLCYADLAILDLESCQYAGLVEFRLQLDEDTGEKLAALFLAIFASTQTRPPVFLVVPQNNAGFRIHQLREDCHWQELPQKQFPHYPTLTAELAAETALAQKVKQARDLNRFAATCYVLAVIIALITVASIAGWSLLTPVQLTLLAFLGLLVIAPHAVGLRLTTPRARSKLAKKTWLLNHPQLPLFDRR